MKSNIDGVFVAGDIRYKSLRQIITACSDGAIAAQNASYYIKKQERIKMLKEVMTAEFEELFEDKIIKMSKKYRAYAAYDSH